MVSKHVKGTKVSWAWGQGRGHGEVAESFTQKVTRQIEDTKVTRDADAENPAYLIVQADGGRVLKSHSELKKE